MLQTLLSCLDWMNSSLEQVVKLLPLHFQLLIAAQLWKHDLLLCAHRVCHLLQREGLLRLFLLH